MILAQNLQSIHFNSNWFQNLKFFIAPKPSLVRLYQPHFHVLYHQQMLRSLILVKEK